MPIGNLLLQFGLACPHVYFLGLHALIVFFFSRSGQGVLEHLLYYNIGVCIYDKNLPKIPNLD